MSTIGFSTGAIAKGDFQHAINVLIAANVRAVELSALRLSELVPLADALPHLDLSGFDYVSVHAPSTFDMADEAFVVSVLGRFSEKGWPIVVHPNVIHHVALWQPLASCLLIENMDRRKPIGRTAKELEAFLDALPAAGVCFDLGHARQVDPTMTEARLILQRFTDRIRQLHVSEVNERSQHDPISRNSIDAFQSIAALLPPNTPTILEPLVDRGQNNVAIEIQKAAEATAAMPVPTVG